MRNIATCVIGIGLFGILSAGALADEGMWLLTNPPRQQLVERYGFDPSPEWLEQMQRSAVRFGGASGSLVSPDGLVLTNHHVGRSTIGKLSTAERDLIADGFYAEQLEDELPCPDLEVTILVSIDDVTERVNGVGDDSKTPAEIGAAKRRMIATIEKESETETGLHSRVVTLYNGGQHHLYRSKRYTDLRLVMAPEQKVASFGGEIDNFDYPRYCADFSLFRIYENGKPLRSKHYLRWSIDGATDGDLALIFGHPGRTNRLDTVADLEFTRDVVGPRRLTWFMRREVELLSFMGRSAEHKRVGLTRLKGVANGRKAWTGYMGGLMDPVLMDRKREQEQRLRAAYRNGSAQTNPWERLDRAFDAYATFYTRRSAIDGVFSSALPSRARMLVRMAEELPKPNVERLREFRDTALPTLERRLHSPQPIYDILEVDSLASNLTTLHFTLGGSAPLTQQVLAGKSPRMRAQELIAGTRLADLEERRRLADGGVDAIRSSDDPLIVLARDLDAESRRLRKRYEDEVQAVEREAYTEIARTKFELDGDSVYPDATSSLRVSFGPVRGWVEEGRMMPAFTTIGGMFERATLREGQPQFAMPDSWIRAKGNLDLDTPMNFVCLGDVIGGNSGSPVVNSDGQVIGLVFDGNLHMLVGRYAYDGRTNRTIAVDARLILEALEKIYGASRIVREIREAGRSN